MIQMGLSGSYCCCVGWRPYTPNSWMTNGWMVYLFTCQPARGITCGDVKPSVLRDFMLLIAYYTANDAKSIAPRSSL